VVSGAVALIALVTSLGVAVAGTSKSHAIAIPAAVAAPTANTAIAPPKVPNAAAIKKKYHGQKITFVGDAAVGASHARDLKLVARFQKDTGIKVKLVPHPSASDASYQQLARAFSSKSSSIDVMMLDVVWPGAFSSYLVNLKPKLGKASKQHAAGIVKNARSAGSSWRCRGSRTSGSSTTAATC